MINLLSGKVNSPNDTVASIQNKSGMKLKLSLSRKIQGDYN